MNFKQWFEVVATSGISPPPIDIDYGDEDESEWEWEELEKRWGRKLEQWIISSDPVLVKCYRIIVEHVFSVKPTIDTQKETNYAYDSVQWHVRYDSSIMDKIENQIISVIRNAPSLWKLLNVRLEDVWNITNKGDVSVFLVNYIIRGLGKTNFSKWVQFELHQNPQILKNGTIVSSSGGVQNDGIYANALILHKE